MSKQNKGSRLTNQSQACTVELPANDCIQCMHIYTQVQISRCIVSSPDTHLWDKHTSLTIMHFSDTFLIPENISNSILKFLWYNMTSFYMITLSFFQSTSTRLLWASRSWQTHLRRQRVRRWWKDSIRSSFAVSPIRIKLIKLSQLTASKR